MVSGDHGVNHAGLSYKSPHFIASMCSAAMQVRATNSVTALSEYIRARRKGRQEGISKNFAYLGMPKRVRPLARRERFREPERAIDH